MDFLTATTTYIISGNGNNRIATAANTALALTDKALDLINFFSQLFTVSLGIVFGLLAVIILLLIFKS